MTLAHPACILLPVLPWILLPLLRLQCQPSVSQVYFISACVLGSPIPSVSSWCGRMSQKCTLVYTSAPLKLFPPGGSHFGVGVCHESAYFYVHFRNLKVLRRFWVFSGQKWSICMPLCYTYFGCFIHITIRPYFNNIYFWGKIWGYFPRMYYLRRILGTFWGLNSLEFLIIIISKFSVFRFYGFASFCEFSIIS